MAKVVVGMSGGVDSAVAAYLLKQEGHTVIGVTLRTWESDTGEDNRCCEIDDARDTARALRIPYHTFNCLSLFKERVTDPFIQDYLHGKTPNPCIMCNRYVKWGKMKNVADILQADYIATGHYASVVKLPNGRYTVQKALHAEKDQTYMLCQLTQEQLRTTLMPLGPYSKQEVRDIAAQAGIPVADKPDSQEICFVPDGDYAGYIEANADGTLPGPGDFTDLEGNVIGKHKGIIHYTVGQRRGLALALGYPAYVESIHPDTNAVAIGRVEALFKKTVLCDTVNFMSIEGLPVGTALSCRVKVRYRHTPQKASIETIGQDTLRITFDTPVKSPAPGQSAAFYDDDDRLIGGAVITEAF